VLAQSDHVRIMSELKYIRTMIDERTINVKNTIEQHRRIFAEHIDRQMAKYELK
jgi:hypothetical protein